MLQYSCSLQNAQELRGRSSRACRLQSRNLQIHIRIRTLTSAPSITGPPQAVGTTATIDVLARGYNHESSAEQSARLKDTNRSRTARGACLIQARRKGSEHPAPQIWLVAVSYEVQLVGGLVVPTLPFWLRRDHHAATRLYTRANRLIRTPLPPRATKRAAKHFFSIPRYSALHCTALDDSRSTIRG